MVFERMQGKEESMGNYSISWRDLLEKLAKFLDFKVSVESFSDGEVYVSLRGSIRRSNDVVDCVGAKVDALVVFTQVHGYTRFNASGRDLEEASKKYIEELVLDRSRTVCLAELPYNGNNVKEIETEIPRDSLESLALFLDVSDQ